MTGAEETGAAAAAGGEGPRWKAGTRTRVEHEACAYRQGRAAGCAGSPGRQRPG